MRKARFALLPFCFGALGLAGSLFAAPAAAQTSPFSAEDVTAACTALVGGETCSYDMGPVPANRRWQIYMVACSNNLAGSTATEIATISTLNGSGQTLFNFPIIPVKLTSNGFTISQLISVPAFAGRTIRIRITSFGADFVANGQGSYCTISGDSVTVP
jgi:hypothetical protein